VVEGLARSAFVTSPVAVSDPVTVRPAIVPRPVSDDETTFDASVVPVNVPAGAITTFPPAAVSKPFALTVKFGIDVDDPNEPTFEFTVARVVARAPDAVVISPVSAGKLDA